MLFDQLEHRQTKEGNRHGRTAVAGLNTLKAYLTKLCERTINETETVGMSWQLNFFKPIPGFWGLSLVYTHHAGLAWNGEKILIAQAILMA